MLIKWKASMITRRSFYIPHSDSSSLAFCKEKKKGKKKKGGGKKVVSPGCDSRKQRRPNRVFGAFVLIPKFGTLNRGAVC